MPYSVPGVCASHSVTHPRHRRSCTLSADDPGSFAARELLACGRGPRFHLRTDAECSGDGSHPAFSLHLTPPTRHPHRPILPFPQTTSPPSSCSPSPSPSPSPAPPTGHSRAASHPIVNGIPLKPSLKDPSPAPQIRLCRSRSEPAPPKNVHFPPPGAHLERVRRFHRHGRPVSVSLGAPSSEETETETELESDSMPRWLSASLPRAPARSPLGPVQTRYSLDAPWLPRRPESTTMVLVEALRLEGDSAASSLALRGSLLVRNAAFEKHLFVRFTLDGWRTTSEVAARWTESAPEVASEPGPGWDRFAFTIGLVDYATTAAPQSAGRGLEDRKLELAARFCTPWVAAGGMAPYFWHDSAQPGGTRTWFGSGVDGPGEWWDNNCGENYRVRFRVAPVTSMSDGP
ncbi:hypothetical protein B0H15DRAFT_22849 [Mycena belliarum]|uniref:CBM21 domain-containing protein n=1 Tax=Mycena belliarum TaxID=1033014 RepID=A0AAD6UNH5_9AGAR|nr:hypothetical protein B0H15DRAFT_22849 [Mycena belliae]